MPIYNIHFKIKSASQEFKEEMLIPSKDAKTARQRFKDVVEVQWGIKGHYRDRDIIYILADSTWEITKVELFKE